MKAGSSDRLLHALTTLGGRNLNPGGWVREGLLMRFTNWERDRLRAELRELEGQGRVRAFRDRSGHAVWRYAHK